MERERGDGGMGEKWRVRKEMGGEGGKRERERVMRSCK